MPIRTAFAIVEISARNFRIPATAPCHARAPP
jgi:hypothetical protein